MDRIIEIAKDRKLETIYGEVLRKNYPTILNFIPNDVLPFLKFVK